MSNVAPLRRSHRRLEYRLLDNATFNVGRLANSYGRSAGRFYLRHFGLSVPEVRVLNVIGHHQPVSAAAISDISVMDKALVSRAVGQLVRLGLVVRGADHDDARRHILTLTPQGRRNWATVLAAKQRRHERSLASLTPDEVKQFYALLARLQVEADKMELEEQAAETEHPAA